MLRKKCPNIFYRHRSSKSVEPVSASTESMKLFEKEQFSLLLGNTNLFQKRLFLSIVLEKDSLRAVLSNCFISSFFSG